MIQFILNEKEISTGLPSGTLLLDFIRYHEHLTGTKIGCREGDCGACAVLIGEYKGGSLQYRSATSCLTAIGNIQGKHVVTVEGTNLASALNPMQQAMCDESATQCGFCTPGFVVSLAGFCLSDKQPSYENAIASIDGNICRCTGYKSIERAAAQVAGLMTDRGEMTAIDFATGQNILPQYFSGIQQKLKALAESTIEKEKYPAPGNSPKFLGGGTDLYVQQHDTMHHEQIDHLFDQPGLNGIEKIGDRLYFGASATVTDLMESEPMQQYFPRFAGITKLVSSTPIRNIATVAGNFINASPIGDFTIFFLALDAQLVLSDGKSQRELPLRKLYKGYKTLDKKPEEFIEKIWFQLPNDSTHFNFEKVSKRTHLDIASVNTAISICMNGDSITSAELSAGGVGPIPAFLYKTSECLKGKTLDKALIGQALAMTQSEISPISDARGNEAYKRLLLQQLIKAHFVKLFPDLELA
ncbi:MAG: FAD binding domain-containing protein [Bacteroidota bacterium]